jgi:hypothetical protein
LGPSAVGSAVWNAVLIGANWDRVSGWIGSYSNVVLVAVVAAAILYPLTRHLLSRKRKDQRIRGRAHGAPRRFRLTGFRCRVVERGGRH